MDLSACKATIVVSDETRIQVATMLAILEATKQVLQQKPQLAQALNEVAAVNTPISQTLTDPREVPLLANVQNAATGERQTASCCRGRRSRSMSGEKQVPREEKWLENTRETLMIVATLIATVTFQAALNPPGGFWQDPEGIVTIRASVFSPSPVAASIHAGSFFLGTAINGDLHTKEFKVFMLANTVGLLASLSIILVLISPTSLRGIVLSRLLVIIMWVAIVAMGIAFNYGSVISSSDVTIDFILVTLGVFAGVIFLIFYGQMVLFGRWLMKKVWRILKPWWLLKKGWAILKGMCKRGSSCSDLGCCQV